MNIAKNKWLTFGALVVTAVSASLVMPTAASADPCAPIVNPIACENSKDGVPATTWDIYGVGDPTIQGFATEISVQPGQQIGFKVLTDAPSFTVKIYRLGWYDGDGAREWGTVNSVSPLPPNTAEQCIFVNQTENYDCGAWGVSASWTVPTAAVSGVYIARLIRPSGGDSHIPFIVRDDSSTSDILFQTSDTTWQAYNSYGGSNFYHGGANGRSYKISYNRPWATRGENNGRDFLFSNEYPMIRFLERNGYDVSYVSGLDTHLRGNLIQNHEMFMSVGHDEYWSGPQRAAVEAARDNGVHLAFFTGNEVYWKTRWEPSVDGASTANRTLVCYKETWAGNTIDPSPEWTGTWRDPRFTPPKDGGKPENGLVGNLYVSNYTDLALKVPAEQGKYRLWRNTSVASLSAGQTATLAPHTVGYESNEDIDNGARPPGVIRLSTTTGSTPEYLRDFGNTVTPGTTTHHLTMYKAASGALVFGAGTVQWAWGLDEYHDGGSGAPADTRMQQATVNLFADMGVLPTTLMSTLTAATPSTDVLAPTATITSPAAGTSVVNGAKVTIQGTAADLGGRVAGVEVTTDGGQTWHPATTGTTAWTYEFYTTGVGSQVVQARAIDDSGNIGQPSGSLQLVLTGSHSIFGQRVPGTATTSDTSAVELGVRFSPTEDGLVTGVRFYKGTGNTGTHTGKLWTNNGSQLLASAPFTGETSTGWQTVTFATPVQVTAGVSYVASYYAPNGRYAKDDWAFSAGDVNAPPLKGKRSVDGSRNGLFRYGGGFPNQSFGDANYWVDVTFVTSQNSPPAVSSTDPLPGVAEVPVSTHPSAVFSKAINQSTLEFTLKDAGGTAVAGTVSYASSTRTATFTPSAPLDTATRYTASVKASDTNGNAMTAPHTWTFTTRFPDSVVKLFANEATPQQASSGESAAVEVGVKFTPSVGGELVGMRFYRGPGNDGPHVGRLWSTSQAKLAEVTFPESAGSGWQTAAFDPPVPLTAGTTYVLSYYAPSGNYAFDPNFFGSTWTNGPLTAPAGSNGVYRYGAGGGFPSSSWASSNYWVDPLFLPNANEPSPSPTPTPSPTGSPTPATTIFTAGETPANANWPDTDPVEVGVKFTTDVAGQITGVRFYKGPENTGTHTGRLWNSSNGQLMAAAVFQNESASGWQTVTFSQPVDIVPGTTYIASYHSSVGRYAVTANQFSGTGLDRAPLHVPAGGGVYQYDYYGGVFPGNSANHNYWVDVMFTPNS